jgi:hypothetical protein
MAYFSSLIVRCPMKRALLQRHIEEAESRIQRGQRNVDHQRKTVSNLERDNQDATIATALLGMFEKALAGPAPQRAGRTEGCVDRRRTTPGAQGKINRNPERERERERGATVSPFAGVTATSLNRRH